MTGTLALRGKELSGEIDAASPRLAITGTGRIALTPQADAELTFRFHDSSLDPYVRLFVPRLSPFTTAVASGSIRVVGRAGRLRSPARGRARSTRSTCGCSTTRSRTRRRSGSRSTSSEVHVEDLQLVGDDTQLRRRRRASACAIERIALQASGDANLGILQGFFRDVRGSGRAELTRGGRRPARRAGVFRQRVDHRRPRPPLLAAQLARRHQRHRSRSTRAASGSTR